MSARSFRAWQRSPALARHILAGFARIQARGAEDADRLRCLGAAHVEALGDLKFAAPPLPFDAAELARLQVRLGGRPVWVAASTHPGEEALVADAHRRIATDHPGLLTIIVPRHPDRGSAIAAELAAPRRAAGQAPPAEGIWIADTLGELGLWFRLAPIVFVGRSLVPPGGGQNPLEPARLGCAIAVGQHVGNFADHVALLADAGALTQVADPASLAAFVVAMLHDVSRRDDMGRRASTVVQQHEELPRLTARALLELMAGH
jgi:3-deoxy-D-manno-octulosonic-acid transferase